MARTLTVRLTSSDEDRLDSLIEKLNKGKSSWSRLTQSDIVKTAIERMHEKECLEKIEP